MLPIHTICIDLYPLQDQRRWDGATQPVPTEDTFRIPVHNLSGFLFQRSVPTAYPALAGIASVVFGVPKYFN